MLKNIFKVLLAPIVVLAIHIFLMFGSKIYEIYPAVDMPMHFLGGASIALATIIGLDILLKQNKIPFLPLWLKLIIALGVTFTAAVVWEYFEWLLDYFFKLNTQLGLNDTMSDLFFDGLGGLIIAGIYWFKKSIKNK